MENGVPDRGDVVWLNFTPQAGHEQAGRRPALVLSPAMYNRFGLMLACPITTQVKGYPFEVLMSGCSISGVALADHLRNMDWRARQMEFICTVPEEVLDQATEKIKLLLKFD